MEQKIKYYQHKEKKDVICEIFNNRIRFGRWVWSNINGVRTCSEEYRHKELTPEFFESFKEITQVEFNHVWGVKLQQA